MGRNDTYKIIMGKDIEEGTELYLMPWGWVVVTEKDEETMGVRGDWPGDEGGSVTVEWVEDQPFIQYVKET